MKVRIVKCSRDTYWYKDLIGEVFTVLPQTNAFSYFVDGLDGKLIDIEDTEPVTDVYIANQPLGKKYDQGKPRYSLLPPNALEEVVKVLTFGSNKYEDFNWMNLDNPNDRFFSAASRHMWAWQKGEKLDSETGYNHLASAVTNLMFILELELLNANKSS